jgi:hypothetical protein
MARDVTHGRCNDDERRADTMAGCNEHTIVTPEAKMHLQEEKK